MPPALSRSTLLRWDGIPPSFLSSCCIHLIGFLSARPSPSSPLLSFVFLLLRTYRQHIRTPFASLLLFYFFVFFQASINAADPLFRTELTNNHLSPPTVQTHHNSRIFTRNPYSSIHLPLQSLVSISRCLARSRLNCLRSSPLFTTGDSPTLYLILFLCFAVAESQWHLRLPLLQK